MTLKECDDKAEAFFNATFSDNMGKLNPLSGKYTIREYSVEPKSVSMKYDSIDGAYTKTFKRSGAKIEVTSEKTYEVANIKKCWFDNECEPKTSAQN